MTLGSYRLLERLGEGPLGETYRARDLHVGRTVTLRIVPREIASDPVKRDQLLTDASLAALSHPHVAALWEIGDDDGRLFLAHEHVTGESLRVLVAGRPMNVRRAVGLAIQVADALAEGASKGVVHGSLRPEVIVVTPNDQVKVLDFGLAAWMRESPPPNAASYLAPEQVLGERPDPRSDLFALGAVLYEMLTGEPPFSGVSSDEIAVRILQATPPPPSRLNHLVPRELDAIVVKLLSKSLAGRHAAAGALAGELRAVAAALDRRPGVVWRVRAARVGRRRFVGGLVAVAGLAAAAGAGWVSHDRIFRAWRQWQGHPVRPVIAVAPFASEGGDQARYFAVGFSEDLATRLGQTSGVVVVARSSIRDNLGKDPLAAARKVGAAAVVQGRVTNGGGRVRVGVELVEVASGACLLNESFEGETAEAMAVQDRIAASIASGIGLEANASRRQPPTAAHRVEPGVYDLYLKGRDAADRRDRQRAIALYSQAVARDPGFAQAQACLAEALYLEAFYTGGQPDPAVAETARRAAESAVAAGPDLALAHYAAGLTAPMLADSLAHFRSAVQIDPSYAEAYHQLGDQIIEIEPKLATLFYRESLLLDPGLDANYRDLAGAADLLGLVEEAAREVGRGRAVRPDRPWWDQMEARFALGRGAWNDALAKLADPRSTESSPAVWLTGRVNPLRLAGRTEEALLSAARLVARYPAFCEGRATLAGLQLESAQRETGRRAVDQILAAATSAEPGQATFVCAATAAAAAGDGRQAALWLGRIANDEPTLRLWMRQATFSGNLAFRRRWFPWSRVAYDAHVAAARSALEAAIDRLRPIVAQGTGGLIGATSAGSK